MNISTELADKLYALVFYCSIKKQYGSVAKAPFRYHRSKPGLAVSLSSSHNSQVPTIAA